ncbi:MAG TPA: hypothetical protein VLA58_05945, partial [Chitinophagaceae bacterium]|nr:hypothetical protein [Chitinophagaceae bacterium]
MRKVYTLMITVWVLSLISSETIAQAPSPDWTKLFAGPTGKGGAGRLIRIVNGSVYVAGSGGSNKGVAGIYV